MAGNLSWGLVSACGRYGPCGRLLRVGGVRRISTTQILIWQYLKARVERGRND